MKDLQQAPRRDEKPVRANPASAIEGKDKMRRPVDMDRPGRVRASGANGFPVVFRGASLHSYSKMDIFATKKAGFRHDRPPACEWTASDAGA